MTDYQIFCDPERIAEHIDQLAVLTETDRPYTRLVFSPEYDQARNWLQSKFTALGLACNIDTGGNLIGRREATNRSSSDQASQIVILGSHIDTVPQGGRFDGIAGVVAALEVVHYLNDQSIELPFDLEIVDFLGEELNEWGLSCLGSRHMAGLITREMLDRVDSNGRVLGDEIARIGGTNRPSETGRDDAGLIQACLELHIEQAKTLEAAHVDIGVVTAIPGIYRYSIKIVGAAGHSGTTKMAERQDALVAAADIIKAVSALANDIAMRNNQHFVATIGRISVLPNAAAVVPGAVEMTLDLRAASHSAQVDFLTGLNDQIAITKQMRHCAIALTQLAGAKLAKMAPELRDILTKTTKELGLSVMDITSGAGHDTAHLSRFAPAAMIFIPCLDGLSHCPQEYASSEAIAKGAAVLTQTILALADGSVAQRNNA
jgi:N-carbamoyl-L-amino-acid hydrolase